MEKRAREQASVRRVILWTVLGLVIVVLLGFLWLALLIYIVVRLVSG